MKAKYRRALIIAVALLVLALSVAPVALRATHWRHVCTHADCPICTAIRDDLSVLRIIAVAVVAISLIRTALLRIRLTVTRAASEFRAVTPVECKVRMNN